MKARQTRQKKIIDSEINKFRNLFSAEDLHNKVKKLDDKISLATVYRFLKELRKNNGIYFYTCKGRLVYSKNKKSHCHFVCKDTGKIIHFDINSLDPIKEKIPGEIDSFQIEVNGRCSTNPKKEG